MNQASDIEAMRNKLGLPNAPLVLSGLRTVNDFFTEKLHYSPLAWISYLRGIDFHRPISMITLTAPEEVVRHKPEDGRPKPFLYFAEPGVSPMRTGTNFPKVIFERYTFLRPVLALKSVASPIAFDPFDKVIRPGGATQFMISASDFSALLRK
jgi:hypothetical protein